MKGWMDKMKGYLSKEVECPFYHREDECGIYCEGVNDESSIKLIHPSREAKRRYRMSVCSKQYKKCPIAVMLYRKWGEDV